jgi:hypothetical protein
VDVEPLAASLNGPINVTHVTPVPVALQSKVWVCSRSLAGIAGSNPVSVFFLSGRGLCDGTIYRLTECGECNDV